METKTVHIPDMHCPHCLKSIKKELESLEGVVEVSGSVENKMATVNWDSPASWDKITAVLSEIGFPADEK